MKFHRLAGTPYSLRQALSWHNLNDVTIEEEKPGEHFAEFQIGFKEIPNSFEIDTIINVAEMAKPLRSRLSRMYNDEYDIRQFVLDSSDWGDILSDYSGVRLEDDGPKLSFGQKMTCEAKLDTYAAECHGDFARVCFAIYDDSFQLDCNRLDDTAFYRILEPGTFFEEQICENKDYIGNRLSENVIDLHKYSKAMVVLSESVLEGPQTYFPGSYEVQNDKEFTLDFSCLSENVIRPEIVAIEERTYIGTKPVEAKCELNLEAKCSVFKEIASFGIVWNPTTERMDEEILVADCKYKGNNTWHDHRHFNVSWNKQNNYTVMN